jgi:peptidoglycan DL-endopeptidase CwlO
MEALPRRLMLALALTLTACAAPARLVLHRSAMVEPPSGPLSPEGRPSVIPSLESRGASASVAGEALAQTAREYVGAKAVLVGGRRFPDDCTGLVRAVYARHGLDLFGETGPAADNGVTAIWRYAQRHGSLHKEKPRPGDIVFFTETYDRNRDGRPNDGLTHVGIVDRVEPDGTVLVIHRVARGVVTYRMNVERAQDRKDAQGRVLNDWLREGKQSRLAGELFAGYATLARR